MHSRILTGDSLGLLAFFFFPVSNSLLFFPVNSSHLDFITFSASSQFRASVRLLVYSPFLHHSMHTEFCFFSLSDCVLCSLMLNLLKNSCFTNVFLFFFFFLVILFLFDCAGPSLLCRLVSSCSEQRLLSSCDVQASHGDDFS